MTQQNTDRENRTDSSSRPDNQTAPEFKPVALPAVAAAVHAARPRPKHSKKQLPAILRKDAMD